MKKSLFPFSAICVAAILFFGCHKHEEIQTRSTYTFTNQTGKPITFDLYGTKEDYYQNANRTQRYLIAPGAVQKIEFDVMQKYWIDWYSDDYSFNNWQNSRSSYNRSSPPPELNIAAVDDAYSIRAAAQDTVRSVLLNGGGISSLWLATLTNSSPMNGTHKFLFRKDFSGEYTYVDMNGAVAVTPFDYSISVSTTGFGIQQRFSLYVVNAQLTTIFQATCTPGFIYTPHTGRDTMMIRFQQFSSLPEFPAVRQQ